MRTLVKLGGSLLTMPELRERLMTVLDQVRSPALLVGGGKAADNVRDWDRMFSPGPVACHELALASMLLNSHMVSSLSERLQIVESVSAAQNLSDGDCVPVLNPVRCLPDLEAGLSKEQHLRRSWHVTSDSIAAWIARQAAIDHVVLLKSVDIDESVTGTQNCFGRMSINGLVDADFPHQADGLKSVSWCNLRRGTAIVGLR